MQTVSDFACSEPCACITLGTIEGKFQIKLSLQRGDIFEGMRSEVLAVV
jgi:hypothetical protein